MAKHAVKFGKIRTKAMSGRAVARFLRLGWHLDGEKCVGTYVN
jgi:hypothetical protein